MQLLSQVLTHNPKLSEICFKSISNDGLALIVASQCGPSLRTIRAKVDDNALEAIQSLCQACSNLRSLSLRNSSAELLNGDAIILAAVQHCPSIEVLSTERWTLTDAGLNALANIHTLKQLKVTSPGCTSTVIQRVLRANSSLVLIRVYIAHVDDALVCCIGNYCGNFKSLALIRQASSTLLNDSTLLELFKGCPLLQSFEMYQQSGMSNTVLRALFEYCSDLTELVLSLDKGNGSPDSTQVLDLEPVLDSHYPTLTKLKITGEGVSDHALHDIFTYCTNIREIKLRNCKQIIDETITILAQNCCKLASLDLYHCKSISILGMIQLVTYCTTLTSLTLTGMHVSDIVLVQLSHKCSTSIVHLHIYQAPDEIITEAGVLSVVERCTGLSFLTVRGGIKLPLTRKLDLIKQGQMYQHIKFDIGS